MERRSAIWCHLSRSCRASARASRSIWFSRSKAAVSPVSSGGADRFMIRVSGGAPAAGGNTRCSSAGSMVQVPLSSFNPEILPLFKALVIVALEIPAALAACPAVYFMAFQGVAWRCMKRICTCCATRCRNGASRFIPFSGRREIGFHALKERLGRWRQPVTSGDLALVPEQTRKAA